MYRQLLCTLFSIFQSLLSDQDQVRKIKSNLLEYLSYIKF